MLQDFAVETGRAIGSIKQRETWGGHKIGIWINSFRTRRDTYDAERQAVLEDLPGWAWTPQDDAWNATLAELGHWVTEHGRMPRPTAADETEQRLGVWKRNNKNRRQGRADDQTTRLRTLLAEHGELMP
ncbi:hypothetical protein AB0442_31845 [Kitasatospora sp. NPDC085895]|uniref:hypothetical protein n=1 Tax=Kitasatospora sp. NPDC085895 TaxID=3155057 RepID=UPI00344F2CBC